MARHAAPPKHRRWWIAAATVLVVAVAAVAVVLVASPGGKSSPTAFTASPSASSSSANRCPHRVTVRVVAASGIAPVVRSVAGHTCAHVTVTVNDDSAAAAALLKRGSADVWIPDSRVRAILAGTSIAASAPSIAVSPIVIAANSGLNTARFSGKTALSWSSLLNQSSLAPLHVEIQNSATSSTALVVASALNGLALTATGDKYLGLASTAVASTIMQPAKSDTISTSALRVEEARLVKGQPNTKILDMTGGYPQLDYPLVARPSAGPTVKAATAQLLQALQGSAGDTARKQQGLLDPGSVAVEPGDYAGTRGGVLVPVPSVSSIPTLYAIADAGGAHGNTLAVLDISGSMADPTATGQESKIEAVQNSAKVAVQLLSPQTRLGLWEFTYQLKPPLDYQQVVPMAPLSSNRTSLINAVDAATPIPTGGTSLYRTVLNAYQYVQANWKPGYSNTVIVFTDGKDETDPGAPSLADVQAQLKAIQNPARPIQLIMLGYGDADIAAMNSLTSTVGGVVYHINSATQIVGAFIDSISRSVLHSLGQS